MTSRRRTHQSRALQIAYGYYGRPVDITLPSGEVIQNQRAIFAVSEVEENIDGAGVEARMRGHSLRLRRETLPEGVADSLGLSALIKITDETDLFEGHQYFEVTGPALSYNRQGDQIIVQIVPAKDPTLPASSTPAGLNFAPDGLT